MAMYNFEKNVLGLTPGGTPCSYDEKAEDDEMGIARVQPINPDYGPGYF